MTDQQYQTLVRIVAESIKRQKGVKQGEKLQANKAQRPT